MERGHASVEYVAVIAVVAAALALAGGAVASGRDLPVTVAHTIERALCLVSGGDCLAGRPRPCVVATDERRRTATLSAFVVHLRDGRAVVRARRSDGTIAITELHTNGALVRVDALGRIGASVGGHIAYGRTFVVADDAAARGLVARLERERPNAGGGVGGAARFVALGRRAGGAAQELVEAGVDGDLRLPLGSFSGLGTEAIALVADHDANEWTLRFRHTSEVAAALAGPLAKIVGHGGGEARIAWTFDEHRRPARLTVGLTTTAHGDVHVGTLRATRGARLELEARLDLREAGVAIGDLIAATRDGDASLAAARRIAEAIASGARIDARAYATDRTTNRTGAGKLLRREVETATESARLLDATGWEPGLGWQRRLDCVRAGA